MKLRIHTHLSHNMVDCVCLFGNEKCKKYCKGETVEYMSFEDIENLMKHNKEVKIPYEKY